MNAGNSLILLILRFLPQKRNLLIPLGLSGIMQQRLVEVWAGALFLQRRHLLPQNEVFDHKVGSAPDTSLATHGRRERRGK